MKLSRGAQRDNLFNRSFRCPSALTLICMRLFNVCANKLTQHPCPLCFDYGVYDNELTNDENNAFNTFNKMSMLYSYPPCDSFTSPGLRT